jgi:hypothetical protein
LARRQALDIPDTGFQQALNRLVESIEDAGMTRSKGVGPRSKLLTYAS